MPGNPRSHKVDATVRKQRSNNLEEIQKYLQTKNIKSEKVLDFICFDYKNKAHRVRYITDAKIIIENSSFY